MKKFSVAVLFKGKQRGLSLLGVLVACAILGIVAVSLSRMLGFSFVSQQSIVRKNDFEAIRQMVMSSISCDKTMAAIGDPATACSGTNGSVVALRNKSNGVIVNDSGSHKIGKFTVVAKCFTSGLEIRAAALKPGATALVAGSGGGYEFSNNPANFSPDPMTKKVTAWDSPSSLVFPAGSAPCGSAFGGSSSTPTSTACAPAQTITSIDFENKTFTCGKSSFGGTFLWILKDNVNISCQVPNPLTGSCSCPTGFSSSVLFHFGPNFTSGYARWSASPTGSSPQWKSLAQIYYAYPSCLGAGPPYTSTCGAIAYVCN